MSTHAAQDERVEAPKTRDAVCILTIGGLDPSGGAGLSADARAQAAFGAHCCPVATAVIAQNTRGVFEIEPVSPEILASQIDRLLEDVAPHAVKIGMVPGLAHAEIIAQRLRSLRHLPIIIDTVFKPSVGPEFADKETVSYIAGQWLPLCDIVTPNTLEAAQLCNAPVDDVEGMARAAVAIFERFGARHVLVKGGHLTASENAPDAKNENTANTSTHAQSTSAQSEADALVAADIFFNGAKILELRARRTESYQVRGTGCLLASALAAQRAQDVPADEAARRAKMWLTQQIRTAKTVGGGSRVAFE